MRTGRPGAWGWRRPRRRRRWRWYHRRGWCALRRGNRWCLPPAVLADIEAGWRTAPRCGRYRRCGPDRWLPPVVLTQRRSGRASIRRGRPVGIVVVSAHRMLLPRPSRHVTASRVECYAGPALGAYPTAATGYQCGHCSRWSRRSSLFSPAGQVHHVLLGVRRPEPSEAMRVGRVPGGCVGQPGPYSRDSGCQPLTEMSDGRQRWTAVTSKVDFVRGGQSTRAVRRDRTESIR